MSRQRAAPDPFADDTSSGHGVLAALGQLVSAHPSLAGGSVAFAVIFGFVAANALWHQPGDHPAPILKTREVATAAVPVASARPVAAVPFAKEVPARTVTTFRIERSDDTPTASIPVPVVAPAIAPAPQPVVVQSAADPVLSQIQAILAAQGLYSGEIDGLMGPKSAAAIRQWEKHNGYSETGDATAELLAVMGSPVAPASPVTLASADTGPVPAPVPRPTPAVSADSRTSGPVTVPAAVEGPSELVQQIQSGLSNIAYADISVDGVAGAQTRAAISAFEKHYRLPVTGQPNETVLKKLLEIGAL
ncbi:peptidoglycan-binding domain-containing protein [Hoeflea ulvae]|uniref:Peptidoglycan-binding protein n=1 Tax=Hoeflea ulvae TaxID=2983764 RepID=A0ABT3YEX2_9HYPH|nr:peptidoglycan-binding protein [Hoeflea ulvae]MCY0094416.1 peptidoglycan-binding protein [Hoeflea ulvae]